MSRTWSFTYLRTLSRTGLYTGGSISGFTTVCRIRRTVSISGVGLVLILGIASWALARQEQPPTGVSFQVVSVTVLTDKEAAERNPDFIGQNVAVRLRLSCHERGIYFFSWKDDFIPLGYALKVTDKGSVWLAGRSGSEPISPGLQKLTLGIPGAWHGMSARGAPAIEWEEVDSTSFAGEKHARTIFIKYDENDKPIEIVSRPYIVPGKDGGS